MKPRSFRTSLKSCAAGASTILFSAASPLAAQEILLSNNFEDDSMGPWQAANGTDAGLYENGDVVSNMGAGDAAINYAPNGNFALWDGRGASFLVLSDPLPLGSRGYTSVTVSYSYNCRNGSTTRRLNLDYSPDNGNTWTTVGTYVTGSGATTRTVSTNLTDQAKFRFAFADSGGAAGPFFVDDIVITATPEFTGQYWDANGDLAGSGGPAPAGTWGIDNFWSSSPDGDVAAGAWSPGGIAVFSAGSDATGEYTVTVDGTQDIGGLSFKDGTPTLSGGALRMTSNSSAYVAPGLTATVASAFADDGGTQLFTKTGAGTLVLSGNNSAATGGMALNSGVTRFESAAAINGTARNLAVNAGGVLAFASSFGAAAIQTALQDRVLAASAGTIAVDGNAGVDFDFSTAGLTAAYLGAIADTTYNGLLMPNGTTYRLGGSTGKLTLTNTSGMNQASPALEVLGNVEISGNIAGFTGTVTKQGSGTLTLSGANAYAANTTASGGTLVLAGSNNQATQTTINAATVQLASNSNGGLANGGITLNNNSAVLQAVGEDRTIGNSILLNASPTISGPQSLTINGALTINNNRQLNNNIVSGKELVLAGQINLSNDDTGRTLTIRSGAASTDAGIGKTVISGDIVNGGAGHGGLTLTSGWRESKPFYLSGTNTYSGLSDFQNGLVTIQGKQALSPGTTVRLNHTSGNNGQIALLDDGAGDIVLPNTFQTYTNNNTGAHPIFVGNNNTANGGTSSGTTTGSTIVIPTLEFNFIKGDTQYSSVNITGANGYGLRIDSVVLNNASARAADQNWQARFNPTTASVSLGDVSMLEGNAKKGIPFLQLEGSAPGNVITGDITEASDALTTGRPLSLNKTGTSVWTLKGENSYTGATAISGGTLIVNGSLDPASAVAVTGTATLGGSGIIGGPVTVAATANLSPGTSVGTLRIGGSLDISAQAGGAGMLNFELGPIAASDKIAVTGGLAIGSGALDLEDFNLAALAGLQNGIYTLISSGGLTGTLGSNVSGTLGDSASGTLRISEGGTDIELVVSGVGDLAGYALWASVNAPSGDPDDDFDGDGVSNALEYVFGGGKDTNDLDKLPVATTDNGNLIFTFVRDQASIDGTTSVKIEVGTDLMSWPGTYTVGADTAGSSPGVAVAKDSPGDGFDTITLTVAQAPDDKKFARLKITVVP